MRVLSKQSKYGLGLLGLQFNAWKFYLYPLPGWIRSWYIMLKTASLCICALGLQLCGSKASYFVLPMTNSIIPIALGLAVILNSLTFTLVLIAFANKYLLFLLVNQKPNFNDTTMLKCAISFECLWGTYL
jgi:hypothetical protein